MPSEDASVIRIFTVPQVSKMTPLPGFDEAALPDGVEWKKQREYERRGQVTGPAATVASRKTSAQNTDVGITHQTQPDASVISAPKSTRLHDRPLLPFNFQVPLSKEAVDGLTALASRLGVPLPAFRAIAAPKL